MNSLKTLLLAMDPDFPELESRATALMAAGYGTAPRLRAARLEALRQVPGLLAGDADLIWNLYNSDAGNAVLLASSLSVGLSQKCLFACCSIRNVAKISTKSSSRVEASW